MLLNFYSLKRKKSVQKFIFSSADNQMAAILSKWISETYKLLPLNVNFPSYMRWVTKEWFSIIGAALRSLIPRYKDTIVSLSPVGTEESYEQNHLYRVASLWTKVALVVMMSLTLTMSLLDITFFTAIKNRYQQALAKPIDVITTNKEAELVRKADEFNTLVAILEKTQTYKKDWKAILSNIFDSSKQNYINIQRILISNAPANNITIQGKAAKKDAVISWKKSLEASGLIKDISLPLEALVETSEGVSFSLNAKI
jgi:hypothetical protein